MSSLSQESIAQIIEKDYHRACKLIKNNYVCIATLHTPGLLIPAVKAKKKGWESEPELEITADHWDGSLD